MEKASVYTHAMEYYSVLKKERNSGEFPGGPVVRTLRFHCRGWVQSLVGELRSHKPNGVAKKKKNRENEILQYATTQMNLEVIMLSEISQSQKDKYCMILLI